MGMCICIGSSSVRALRVVRARRSGRRCTQQTAGHNAARPAFFVTQWDARALVTTWARGTVQLHWGVGGRRSTRALGVGGSVLHVHMCGASECAYTQSTQERAQARACA